MKSLLNGTGIAAHTRQIEYVDGTDHLDENSGWKELRVELHESIDGSHGIMRDNKRGISLALNWGREDIRSLIDHFTDTRGKVDRVMGRVFLWLKNTIHGSDDNLVKAAQDFIGVANTAATIFDEGFMTEKYFVIGESELYRDLYHEVDQRP